MPARYLLDTNIVSYAIRGEFPEARKRLNSVPLSSIAISAFTQAELMYGLARKAETKDLRAAVEGFLSEFEILPWDSAAACSYGELRAALERKGRVLSHEDLMIASHALSLGLVLVTRDKAFSRIDGLRVDDWTRG